MSAVSEPAAAETLTADVARRCRAGLGAAASALYAGAAEATAAALRDRAEAGGDAWPWLPGLCYRALEPLGVAFPSDERAMTVAGKAVLGRPVRGERVMAAARHLHGQADAAGPEHAPDPELAAAVERFWDQLARLAQHLGQAVRAGDEAAVERALEQARPRLRRSAGAVRTAAEQAAARTSLTPPSPPSGGAPASDRRRSAPAGEPGDVLETRPVTRPSRPAPHPPPAAGPAPEVGEPEPAPLQAGPVWPAAKGPAAPPAIEEEGGALEPDRPYAPLVFVGGALLLAMVLLVSVAAGAVDLG